MHVAFYGSDCKYIYTKGKEQIKKKGRMAGWAFSCGYKELNLFLTLTGLASCFTLANFRIDKAGICIWNFLGQYSGDYSSFQRG